MNILFNKKKFVTVLLTVSILVPLLIAYLFIFSFQIENVYAWVYKLPYWNALLNGSTAILLIIGWVCIKLQQQVWHRNSMVLAFFLSSLFLIFYVIYHASVPSVVYGDTTGNGQLSKEELLAIGYWRNVYLSILLSHILFSISVIPLVFLTMFYAITGRLKQHKRIARYALPIWLYVSLTGVVVYNMIKPYYQYIVH